MPCTGGVLEKKPENGAGSSEDQMLPTGRASDMRAGHRGARRDSRAGRVGSSGGEA